MKKIKTLFVALTISLVYSSCNKPKNLTTAEVYKILNEIIADNNIQLDVVCASVYTLPISGEWSSEFTSKDQTFIKDQQKVFKDFKLESHKLKSFWPRTGKFIDVVIDETCKSGILDKLSFPIVSADRQKVLLEIGEDCNCMLGGYDEKILFIKVKGHWKRSKWYDYSISQNNSSNQSENRLSKQPKI
jgi:hypothetical protein